MLGNIKHAFIFLTSYSKVQDDLCDLDGCSENINGVAPLMPPNVQEGRKDVGRAVSAISSGQLQ